MKQKILLVEDERKLADTIQFGLYEHNYEVAIASNGEEGKNMFEAGSYDLIIVDLNLPKISGYDLCKIIREKDKNIPVLILTALNFTEYKLKGFESGADDYLIKPFEFSELLARIRALLRRAGLTAGKQETRLLKAADLEMNLDSKEVRRSGQKINLTVKEFHLLEYLLRNKNKVVSREAIAKNVWDIDFDTQTNVIDVYVNYLRKKIDKDFTPKLIYTQIGMGYILRSKD